MTNKHLKLSPSTRRAYRHWCDVFRQRHGSITTATQDDIDAFFAWMVSEEYPRSTCNQAKNALKHYAAANGLQFDIHLVSLRTDNRLPNLISPAQAACVIAALPPFYRPIAEAVYHGCVPPGVACGQHKSALAGTLAADDATVAPQTFNAKLRAAGDECGVLFPLAGKTLQQSGIIAALRAGADRDWLLTQAQISRKRLAWYVRVAGVHS